jgi:Fur family ferric uptake transcriptional regulator
MPLSATEWSHITGTLAARGLRCTLRRRAIIEAILSIQGYFDAETLHGLARKVDTQVSRATVYRTLLVLCELGWLHQTDFGDGHYHYRRHDAAQPPSVEIFVVECGGVFEQAAPFLTWYGQTVSNRLGLELIGARLQLFTRCRHPQRGGKCAECPHAAKTVARLSPKNLFRPSSNSMPPINLQSP